MQTKKAFKKFSSTQYNNLPTLNWRKIPKPDKDIYQITTANCVLNGKILEAFLLITDMRAIYLLLLIPFKMYDVLGSISKINK